MDSFSELEKNISKKIVLKSIFDFVISTGICVLYIILDALSIYIYSRYNQFVGSAALINEYWGIPIRMFFLGRFIYSYSCFVYITLKGKRIKTVYKKYKGIIKICIYISAITITIIRYKFIKKWWTTGILFLLGLFDSKVDISYNN